MPLSQVLSQLGLVANRPKFELAFNQLQNTMLKRLNEKIEKLNDTGTESGGDPFAQIALKKVEGEMPLIRSYAQATVTGGQIATSILANLDKLDQLAADGDADAYNAMRDSIEKQLDQIPPPSSPALGLYFDDGVAALQKAGTGLSDFVDQPSATAEINVFRDRALTLAESMTNRQVHATTLLDQAEAKLNSIQVQLEASQVASKAELIDLINKEKEKTGQLLQMLSLAFEVDQGRQEQLAAQLQQSNTPAPGSVLNLFL